LTASDVVGFDVGQVWQAKHPASFLTSIRIVGATESGFAWTVEVLSDGGHVTMSGEAIRRDFRPAG
jgi:hypothetical protein